MAGEVFVNNERTDNDKTQFDDYGRLQLKESIILSGSNISRSTKYRYMADTVHMIETSPNQPDKIRFSVFSNYDAQGNPQTETKYTGDTVSAVNTYSYEYY